MKRNCTIADIPKKYSAKCEAKVNGFFKPYTLDVKSFDADLCELDSGMIDVSKVYDDAPCSTCEAGNFLSFSQNGSSIECLPCSVDTYLEKSKDMPNTAVNETCKSCKAGNYLIKGISLRNFNELPNNYEDIKFSTTCTAIDWIGKENKCSDSKGFKTEYLKGIIAG